MSDAELAARALRTTIFARVTPDQKLRLVEAFKADGEIVGMTGDGVNDAPSLKAAHIGIAMGKRGTDVAREAAALVLLEDDFAAIVGAVHLGRRIYGNLRKAMAYVTGVHVAIAGTALLPILLGWPPLLFPVHVVFIEMIVDSACSIVFEAEPAEADAMTRPPRDPAQSLFGRTMLLRSATQGFGALTAVIAVAASEVDARQILERDPGRRIATDSDPPAERPAPLGPGRIGEERRPQRCASRQAENDTRAGRPLEERSPRCARFSGIVPG